MDVKAAVKIAKTQVADLFADEEIVDIGLEEVEFDDSVGIWIVTIGFSRPWEQKNALTAALGEGRPSRSYKVIRLADADGRMVALEDHFLSE
ncbi:MAG: hypothetical protein F4X72_06575 [Dehalococcoidia bacterium]|nr:hypothetical protein [Dehalococcoidia bacterium]